MRITSSFKPIFWQLMENAVVYYKGNWKLDVWNKFFSHAPVRASSHTLNILLQSFKQLGSTLKWNGRQRYVGNSFASLSPYWSFLTTPPLAFSLGEAARYFNNKGIDSIAKCYDSKWEILSFPAIRRTYAVGSAYRSKWIQIALFLQEYQVPLSIDFSDPWRDWLLVKHTRWWIGKANTFYPLLLSSDDITLQCNAHWKLEKAPSRWHTRFSLLWESSLTFRMKIFRWRIFTSHFTLGAFLSRHGLQGVRCPHCASYDENMRHVFWTCSFTQRWWNKLFSFPIWDMRPSKIGSTFFLIGSGDKVLDWVRKRCISLLLWNIWMFRSKKLFQSKGYVPSFSWALCKLTLHREIDVMPDEDRTAFASFLETVLHTCVCGNNVLGLVCSCIIWGGEGDLFPSSATCTLIF
ncbi:hypothetical protein KP509_17G014800 [Ceratopteris richardii]|uniref:Reverse transcriptase zinc-binding domain-containing protein n=2 Tax=Ceratopteris richardii TaxID=49495 RepID=A0A8T2SX29_CERRI|nr:hypothetical protein KP509_17G014800 [Ceratopteris richardii]